MYSSKQREAIYLYKKMLTILAYKVNYDAKYIVFRNIYYDIFRFIERLFFFREVNINSDVIKKVLVRCM